ncbi:MAG TPA: DUF5990 family protein [Pyrinomonadaceae bacterium]|nr:DUF5990 family protein [Pyrinomonadaceae bacterium]
MEMEIELKCRVVLGDPPPGVDFALQLGRGADSALSQRQRSRGKDLQFETSVAIAGQDDRSGPDFRGPGVQGPRGQRFIYVNSGTYAGQANSQWGRRLKIPLVGITRDMIERASRSSGAVLEARVPGTARDGGPNCATVKPFRGWTLKQ